MSCNATVFGCLLLCLALVAPAWAHAKGVVVFHGLEWRAPSNRVLDQVLREDLGVTRDGSDLRYYTEFIDGNRFAGEAHEQRLADFLRARYSEIKVDAIIVMDPSSLRFMVRYRDRIFPGTPVAYAGLRDVTLSRLELPRDFIGTSYPMNAQPTVDLALRLRPEARELVIITGTAELDRSIEEQLRAAAAAAAPNLRMRVLTGLAYDQIVAEVGKLPPDAIIVTGPIARDGAGRAFTSALEFIERVRATAPVPIVHTFENAVGRGALASYSVPIETIPRQAAAVAKQLLDGVAPASVVLPPTARLRPFVDLREMKRWGIPEERLPADTVVRFRELTMWDQYRYQILGIMSAVLLQTALIALLLVQRRRRERAEARLQESEQTMTLAAEAAELVMWSWDVERDIVMRVAAGGSANLPVGGNSFESFLSAIHPEDRHAVTRAIRRALDGDGHYEVEYRATGAGGTTRWFAGRGRVEREEGQPLRLRGITLDITSRKDAELDAQHRRNELAHLSRVTMVGEMSGSIAHELNQPLTAILANAQAAQMFIRHEPLDVVELSSILDDIVENDKRAGEIIQSLRRMLKKGEAEQVLLVVNELVQDVLRLMHNDLVNRQVSVETRLAPSNPLVRGDRTQLQQVVMNLLLNACDAMAPLPRSERVLAVSIEVDGAHVRVKVADRGEGIKEGQLEEIFTPFFTTKPQGLGLGLAVCRTIITSHGGSLRAENNRERGATFTFVLDAETEAFA
jgi:signal transduction histidine kinase